MVIRLLKLMVEFSYLNRQNEKLIKSLHLGKYRKLFYRYIAEGLKLCEELLDSNVQPDFIVIDEFFSNKIVNELIRKNFTIYHVESEVYNRISDTKNPQGILACVKIPESIPDNTKNFIALDGVSDPGNVGTIIRTAEWFGFNQIILGAYSCDAYSSKVVRASMGSIFRVNCIHVDNLSEYLKNKFSTYEIYAASIKSDNPIENCKPEGLFGIVIGSESHGLSGDVQKVVSKNYLIKGKGKAESLNAAVASGISLYYFSSFIN
jgi:RNA methyltransferase, TrmH family